jgi:hypothetical protein
MYGPPILAADTGAVSCGGAGCVSGIIPAVSSRSRAVRAGAACGGSGRADTGNAAAISIAFSVFAASAAILTRVSRLPKKYPVDTPAPNVTPTMLKTTDALINIYFSAASTTRPKTFPKLNFFISYSLFSDLY